MLLERAWGAGGVFLRAPRVTSGYGCACAQLPLLWGGLQGTDGEREVEALFKIRGP